MSTKFPPAILGPEMAAPILWAPGILWFFLLENSHAHKIPPFRGGGVLGLLRRGGGSADFIFMGVVIFPRKGPTKKLCDKDFAERSAELCGAICLKTLVLLANDQ